MQTDTSQDSALHSGEYDSLMAFHRWEQHVSISYLHNGALISLLVILALVL